MHFSVSMSMYHDFFVASYSHINDLLKNLYYWPHCDGLSSSGEWWLNFLTNWLSPWLWLLIFTVVLGLYSKLNQMWLQLICWYSVANYSNGSPAMWEHSYTPMVTLPLIKLPCLDSSLWVDLSVTILFFPYEVWWKINTLHAETIFGEDRNSHSCHIQGNLFLV